MKPLKYACLSVALLTLAACGQMGAPEAPLAEEVIKPLSEVSGSALGGSETSPVSVVTDGTSSSLEVTFTISGKHDTRATFKVNQNYNFNGSSWIGSNPVTFTVDPRLPISDKNSSAPPPEYRTATIALTSSSGSGTSTVQVSPFDATNTNINNVDKPKLVNLSTDSAATVYVRFVAPTPPNTAPSITVPDDTTVEATNARGAVANFAAGLSASDLEEGDLTARISCTPESGSTFEFGETTVTCSVADSGGLSASRSFKVTVVDTAAPVISGMPSNQTLEATGPSGAVANWTAPSANDLVDGAVAVNCDATSGNIFALGTKTVTCTATDARKNSATSSFTITVQDKTAPTITLSESTIYDGSFYFGSVPAAPTCKASDLVTETVSCDINGYSTGIGTHTLIATAKDAAGNTATATRSYTVLAWTLKGFYSPVDMGGVVNTIKAGATVPLKFEVFAASERTSTSDISSFTTATVPCDALSGSVDEIEVTTTGGTSLRYDSTAGQFVQNWQTPKVAGACYRATMKTQDGSSLQAFFKTR